MEEVAKSLEISLLWIEPIRPGDLYLAMRNIGPKLLVCRFLGESCVHPTSSDYAYDFSECVLVKEE